ncbi:MAG: DUF86 domain-containing protein [Lautropia sp.]|nr:DUF86 domain-containing protein [Lautropia sp.]
MADDVLLNKAAVIERCVRRVREAYADDPDGFSVSFDRQDVAILNVLRACQAVLDVGQHLVRRERLGLPQSARDVFGILAKAGWIEPSLAEAMKRMAGFRNIAVHDDQAIQFPMLLNIIQHHLDEFLQFNRQILAFDGAAAKGEQAP